jgi:phosphatidylserine/phosphatidylglycerophosphate/cardiolipin synthase-like enzyme
MKLIVQPDAGVDPVVRAIQSARRKIDVLIFRFDRVEIEKALGDAVLRGVTVRALIAHTNRGGEARLRKLEQRLLAAGLIVSRSADDLIRYHAKLMIADSVLYLFGFNFTRQDIDRSRSFAIATTNAKAVGEAGRLFDADVTRQPFTTGKSNLVVSPENARAMLSAFIAGAKRDLAIYDAKIQDPAMIKLLKDRAAEGVTIRVIGSIKGRDPNIAERKLATLKLHVRSIVRDGTHAFVGSQSLRKDELENRREVGLIVNNPAVAAKILQVFEADWRDSAKGSAAKTKSGKAKKIDKKAA